MSNLDFDRFRLRTFVDLLSDEGDLEVHDGLLLRDLGRHLENNPKAVLFRAVAGGGGDVVGNIMSNRRLLALAFGVDEAGLRVEMYRRIRGGESELIEIAGGAAPVHEVVKTGAEVDLFELPNHLQHALDGAPTLSSAMDHTAHPETGRRNIGIRRMMWHSKNQIGMLISTDLSDNYKAARARGENLPITVTLGSHPLDYFAASTPFKGDELAFISTMRDAPLPVVKGITNDVLIPADAEWSLEGYLGPETLPEGPYGEWCGYYGEMTENMPMMHVTAITRRHDPMMLSATVSTRHLQFTDNVELKCAFAEFNLWETLAATMGEPLDVYCPPNGAWRNVRIKIKPQLQSDGRNTILAAFAAPYSIFKNVYVVGPDIDIRSDREMEWALATRFQPSRDLIVLDNMAGVYWPMDPSGRRHSLLNSVAGYDLTWGPEQGPNMPEEPRAPRYEHRRFSSLAAALEDGPKYFEELMAAVDSPDGRDVMAFLCEQRESGRLGRTPGNGRYYLLAGGEAEKN